MFAEIKKEKNLSPAHYATLQNRYILRGVYHPRRHCTAAIENNIAVEKK